MSQTKAQLIDGSVVSVAFSAGTAAAPSIYYSADTTTGVYFPGTGQVALATNGTGRLFVDSSGNVGVGATPAAVTFKGLDVFSGGLGLVVGADSGASTRTDATTKLGRILAPHFTNAEEPVAGLIISNDNTDSIVSVGGGTGLANAATVVRFFTAANTTTTTGTERMRLDSSGRLALGSSSPSYQLHVASANTSSSATIFASDSGGRGLLIQSPYIGNAVGKIGISGTDAAFAIGSGSSNTTAIYIDTSQRVGIGTTTPGTELHVAASSGYAELRLAGASGSGGSVEFYNSTTQLGDIFIDASNNMIFRNASEAFRVDSNRRLLVGTPTARDKFFGALPLKVQVEGADTTDCSLAIVRNDATADSSKLILAHARGTSYQILSNNDAIGDISWQAADGNKFLQGAHIRAFVDGTPGVDDMPTRLVFSTTADGASSPTERMRIQADGNINLNSSVYNNTTVNAANMFVNSGPIHQIYRSTSSIRYKTNVETLEDSYADAILNCRPVWYRSLCKGDNKDHGYWGFIAEEVGGIDPRLVFWTTKKTVVDEDGTETTVELDQPEADGVQYDRFVPHLLNLIKRQKEQIETMEARLSALEAS